MTDMTDKNKNVGAILKRKTPVKKSEVIFLAVTLGLLAAHWAIIFVGGNINSILLAFQRFDVQSYSYKFYTGKDLFTNFSRFFRELFAADGLGKYVFNGVMFHLVGIGIGYPLSLMFAYLIYKKLPGHKAFQILLYLPTIFSAMVVALLSKYFLERGVAAFTIKHFSLDLRGIFTDAKFNFGTLLIYTAYFAVPGNLLVNLGTMSRTPPELVESGKLEGISLWQEFVHLILPMMYPVIEIQCLGIFVGFFTAQGPLYAVYADKAPVNVRTFGYWMFTSVVGDKSAKSMYGYTAAINLIIGVISVPIVYLTKRLFDRFDPEAEF